MFVDGIQMECHEWDFVSELLLMAFHNFILKQIDCMHRPHAHIPHQAIKVIIVTEHSALNFFVARSFVVLNRKCIAFITVEN